MIEEKFLETAIEINNISKRYGHTHALQNVSFCVKKHEIITLLGPDGAGKSTLVKILSGLIDADTGSASILGHDIREEQDLLKNMIGYMPQKFSLYEELTLSENLDFYATIFGLGKQEKKEKIDYFLNLTDLTEHSYKHAGQLSGGMKQKLALAVNLIHRPEVLFLDEPSTGVDPVARQEFWKVLYAMRDAGVTVVVATPYMEEAERSDRIALMHQGRLLIIGEKEEIISHFPFGIVKIHTEKPFAIKRSLQEKQIGHSITIYGNSLHVVTQNKENTLKEILVHFPDCEAEYIEPSIEDTYIHLTGKTGDENG